MPGKATSADTRQNGGEAGDSAGLREELSTQRQEVLRLRDLLIAKDAELGAARGRLAEFEAGSMQIVNVVARLRGLVPAFMRKAFAGLRKPRG